MRIDVSFSFKIDTEHERLEKRHDPPDDRLSGGPRWGPNSQSGQNFELRPPGEYEGSRIRRLGWRVARCAGFVCLCGVLLLPTNWEGEAVTAVLAMLGAELLKWLLKRR